MKVKQILGAILMIILTVSGILFGLLISITTSINSDAIINFMIKANYLTDTEEEAKTVLNSYLTESNTNTVLNNISVKSNIRELAMSLDNNTVNEISTSIKENMQKEIVKVIEDNIDEKTKQEFASVVSEAYIKTIFPVSEFNILSSIYKKYSSNINLIYIVLGILIAGIYMYLACGKKTYKWNIVALYNIIIVNILLIILTHTFNNIVIGNVRTTAVINEMIKGIKTTEIIYTAIIFVVAIISNYIAYFRHKK